MEKADEEEVGVYRQSKILDSSVYRAMWLGGVRCQYRRQTNGHWPQQQHSVDPLSASAHWENRMPHYQSSPGCCESKVPPPPHTHTHEFLCTCSSHTHTNTNLLCTCFSCDLGIGMSLVVKQKNSSLCNCAWVGLTSAAGHLLFREGQEDRQRAELPQTSKQTNNLLWILM